MTFSETKLCFTKPWPRTSEVSEIFTLHSNLLRQAWVACTITGNNSCSCRMSKGRSQQNRLLNIEGAGRKHPVSLPHHPQVPPPPPIISKNLGKMVISSFPSAVDQEQVAPSSHLENTNNKKIPRQSAFSKWQTAVVLGWTITQLRLVAVKCVLKKVFFSIFSIKKSS